MKFNFGKPHFYEKLKQNVCYELKRFKYTTHLFSGIKTDKYNNFL